MEPLRLIGYWRNDAHPEYPDPADFVDPTWDEEERESLYAYLRHGVWVRGFMGHSACRLCEKRNNGNGEISDGTFIWPEGLAHYVAEHAVRLPVEFIEHARREEERLESLEVDLSWWLDHTARQT